MNEQQLIAHRNNLIAENSDAWRENDQLQKKLEIIEDFLLDLANNYDCDSGPNGAHSDHCRCCEAKKLLMGKGL